MENESVQVRVEAVEERPSVVTTTVINHELVHLLAKIAARNDEKNQRRKPLYNLFGVFILGVVVWMFVSYFITKTQTSRGPVLMLLLLVMDAFLFWYVNQPIERFMERRMQPFLGQEWRYTVSEEGVSLLLNGQEGTFTWDELSGWWLEDGYYLMEVGGQAIALRQQSLSEEEQERLHSLLYIYLGNPIRSEQAAPGENLSDGQTALDNELPDGLEDGTQSNPENGE